MENNKQNKSLIISIITVVAIMALGIYYYNFVPKGENRENTFTLDTNFSASTPKEIFLERNTKLYESKSFDEMMAISKNYDSEQRVQENEELFKETDESKKEVFFGFAQALMVPTESFAKVEETINDDTATVTAIDNKGNQSTASFIKENGVWKISEISVLQNPSE